MSQFAVLTGASKGLGKYLAKRFWVEGYNLCLVTRDSFSAQELAMEFPERSGQAIISLTCDLGDSAEVSNLIKQIRTTVSNVSVLINNAAIQGPIGSLCENEFSGWEETLQVNLLAPVVLCRGLIPLMRENGEGSIINLSGGGATGPRVNFSAYATAKAGLVRFSETIAEELKASGIRVNCIAPGAMKTAMLEKVILEGSLAGERELSLAKKVFEDTSDLMDRVADLALFLASDASKGITGKLISAVWDNWEQWPKHIDALNKSDAYTLRRIAGRERGMEWGDK